MVRACDNPFRTERLEAIEFRPQGLDWDRLMARLEALSWRAAVVGGEGRGKTSLLEQIMPRLVVRGFRPWLVRLAFGESKPSSATLARLTDERSADFLLIDSAEQLSPRGWQTVQFAAKHARGMIIATHRAGMLPTLMMHETSVVLLRELIAELLETDDHPLMDEAGRLFVRHEGNIRHALLECYDLI